MKKKIFPIIFASLLFLAGCTPDKKVDYPINIRLGDNIITEYHINSEFVAPDVYSVFDQADNIEDKKLDGDAKFSGYDLAKTGKQTVNVSYETKNKDGQAVTLTENYDIYVYGYSEFPQTFKNVEGTFKDVVTTFYDLNEVEKIGNYTYDEADKSLYVVGTASLEGTNFEQMFQNLLGKFNDMFIKTSIGTAGTLKSGQPAYQFSYTDKKLQYDIEVLFVNLGETIGYQVYFYNSYKIAEWPKDTVNTILSWITDKEEVVPALTGDLYGFNVGAFAEYGVAMVNTYVQEDPTDAYKAKLIENGYELITLPEYYTYFYKTLAISGDGEVAIEYGFENGVFTLAFSEAQEYEFNPEKAAYLVGQLVENTNTVIPPLEGAYIYGYYPEMINYGVTVFRAYSLEDEVDDLLDNYMGVLATANWAADNNGQPNDNNEYAFISPEKDIKVGLYIDEQINAIQVTIYTYKEPSAIWPAEEVATLLSSSVVEEIPAYEGEFTNTEISSSAYFNGIIVYIPDEKGAEAKEEYIETIGEAGYTYQDQNSYGDLIYNSPNGEITLTIYSVDSGTFTIEVQSNVKEAPEVALENYFKNLRMYDENAETFIEALKDKFVDYEVYQEQHGYNMWYFFEATIEGNVIEAIATFAEASGCDWYDDENPQCWYSMNSEMEIDPLYDEATNTTSIRIII